MCHYHSISVNRKGNIAHEPNNSHTTAVRQKEWTENTFTKTYHWDFEYDPDEQTYPGALKCLTGDIYAQEPAKRVLDVADEHYRRLIALHKGDYSHLEYFSGEDYTDVREKVAQNINTPVETLAQLAEDPDFWTRCAIARNPNTPAAVLEQLSKEKNVYVRNRVACNPNTSIETLELLLSDWISHIQDAARDNLNARTESN